MVRIGWREAWGIVLIACGALAVLSLLSYEPTDIRLIQSPPNSPPANFIGPAGAWIAFISFMSVGITAYLFPVAIMAMGGFCIFKREGRVWPKAVQLAMFLLACLCLAELQVGWWGGVVATLNIGNPGGIVGYLVADRFLISLLGAVGTSIVAVATLLISLVFLVEVHPLSFFGRLGEAVRVLHARMEQARSARRTRREELEHEEKELAKRRRRLEEAMQKAPVEKAQRVAPPPPAPQPASAEEPVASGRDGTLPGMEPPDVVPKKPRFRKTKKPEPEAPTQQEAVSGLQSVASNYVLPPIDLLNEMPPAEDREIKGDFQRTAAILKETLTEFGIDADVTNVERGPVVTRYQVLPAPGVRVERIAALSNNIALAMKAESVRIQAPIPGKGVVGIEVPNQKSTIVYAREILESDEWQMSTAALPLALGKDVGGRVIVGDLADMPHLLIAGATGSGKTVCMNSILAGLLMSRTPDQMRLMLIDPKIVEFSGYNSLAHLVVPVITDPKKVMHGLKWAITEMENRYKLFAKVGVRNIAAFNTRPIAKQTDMFGSDEGEEAEPAIPDRIPYLVIVVDELADLMLVAPADIENGIARLAQLSRAVGIHMIIATQRPSVNVITGTIKANLPARIAFQVAQKIDSRTILDANGADKLLGKGDMLFLPPGTSKLIRAQGTLTTDQEIRDIVDFIKEQGSPQYETAIKDKIESKTADLPEMDQDDELLETAVEVIRQTKRASTSSLQRRLRIGYTRAARLMDLLEEKGIVGPPRGSDPREILVDLDGEIPQNASERVGAE